MTANIQPNDILAKAEVLRSNLSTGFRDEIVKSLYAEAEAIAAQVSAALPKGPAVAKTVQPSEPKAGQTHIEFPSKQTHLLLSQLGIDRDDPDYAALALGNSILGGGGFGTRLMTQVREKRGLTYGVYSNFSPMQARGPFMINLQTRAEMSGGTLRLVEDVLADYLKTGPTQKELDDAKRELAEAAAKLVPGIHWTGGLLDLLVAGCVLGLVNLLVRPLVELLSCPLVVLVGL